MIHVTWMIKIKNCILTTQSLTCLVPHWKFIVTSWDLTRDWHPKHFLQEHSPMYAMQGLLTPLRRAQSICARQYTKSWVVLGTRQRWERQQTSHSIAIVPPDQPRYGRCFVEFASTAICTQRQNISWSALKRITEWSDRLGTAKNTSDELTQNSRQTYFIQQLAIPPWGCGVWWHHWKVSFVLAMDPSKMHWEQHVSPFWVQARQVA